MPNMKAKSLTEGYLKKDMLDFGKKVISCGQGHVFQINYYNVKDLS